MEKLVQVAKIVNGWSPQASTATAGLTSDYVSLKNYRHLTIIIKTKQSTGSDTGAVALVQATNVSAGSEKALGFDWVWVNSNTASSDTLTKTAVTSDTFNAGGSTNACMYVIEVDVESLDVDNNFDCVAVKLATLDNGVADCTFILSNARWIDMNAQKTAITD